MVHGDWLFVYPHNSKELKGTHKSRPIRNLAQKTDPQILQGLGSMIIFYHSCLPTKHNNLLLKMIFLFSPLLTVQKIHASPPNGTNFEGPANQAS